MTCPPSIQRIDMAAGNVSDRAPGNHETAKWDPSFTEQLRNVVAPAVKRWFRADVRGVDNIPQAGGALVVSNHSGGMLTPDVFIFASAFYDAFGYQRPVYTLAHYRSEQHPASRWRVGGVQPFRRHVDTGRVHLRIGFL